MAEHYVQFQSALAMFDRIYRPRSGIAYRDVET